MLFTTALAKITDKLSIKVQEGMRDIGYHSLSSTQRNCVIKHLLTYCLRMGKQQLNELRWYQLGW